MSLSLSTHHLAAIILHSCQTTACTMGSPPPLGLPSTERPLRVCVTPPLPPLSSFPWELVAAPLCGQRLCSVLLSGDSFIINQMSILSYCAQTELNDCPDHHVMVNLH